MIYLAAFAGSDAALGLSIAAMHLAERPGWMRMVLLDGLALVWSLVRLNAIARLSVQLLCVPVAAGATSVASYPYLWRNPIGNTRALLD